MSPRESPTRRYHASWHRSLRYFTQRIVMRAVVGSTVQVKVEGLDNLDALERPFVLVANHSSHLDTTVLLTALPWRVTSHLAVGAASDYFYNHMYRSMAASAFFNTFPVHRPGTKGRGAKRSKGMTRKLINERVPVLIYPEGTRSRDGKMAAFKPGVAAICADQQVACVPVALLGTFDAMPPGRNWPVPGRPRVRVLVGRPMRPRRGEAVGDFNERLTARVRTMIDMQTPYVLADKPAAHERATDTGEERPGKRSRPRDAQGPGRAQEEAS